MTNSIGTGTCTKSFNGPKGFMAEAYKWAITHSPSLSEFLREAVIEKVAKEDPVKALRLKAELKHYYGSLILAMFTIFHFSLVVGNASGADWSVTDEARRAPRTHRLRISRKDTV